MMFLIVLIGLPLLGWMIYRLVYPVYRWHQTITVTIDTPNGPISGESTQVVRLAMVPQILPDARSFTSNLWGEAVVVDLGGQTKVFLLLEPHTHQRTLTGSYAVASRGIAHLSERQRWARMTAPAEPLDIPFTGHYASTLRPMVTFADPADRDSMTALNPDAMAATLGEGYAFLGATIQVTKKPKTLGQIEKTIPFWGEFSGFIESNPNRRDSGHPLYAVGWKHFKSD